MTTLDRLVEQAATRERLVAQLVARREARGASDPLAVLRATTARLVAEGYEPIIEVSALARGVDDAPDGE